MAVCLVNLTRPVDPGEANGEEVRRENPGKRWKSSRWFWALSCFGQSALPFSGGKSGRKSPGIEATSFPLGGKNGPTARNGAFRQITLLVLAVAQRRREIWPLTNGVPQNLLGSKKSTSGSLRLSGNLPNIWTIFAAPGIVRNSSAS